MIIVVKTVLVMISLILIFVSSKGSIESRNDRTLESLFTLFAWTFIEIIVLAIMV